MKTENAFEIEFEHKLSQKQFENVLALLNDADNSVYIQSNVWNLINTVCLTLKTKELLEDDTDLELSKKILLNLVDKGKPKEMIVALLEEADSFKTNAYFCLLLDPLKETLKKVPDRRGKSLEYVLSILNAHIQTLPVPKDLNLQGEEKLLLDADPAVIETTFVLTHYLHFINMFVEEASIEYVQKQNEVNMKRITQQRDILQKFILILLNHPFLYHDLHVESCDRPKSTIRVLCEGFLKSLAKICFNVYLLYKHDAEKPETECDDDTDMVPSIAFSNLAYLVFVENLAADFQPLVYSHQYIFMKNLKYIMILLQKKENLILFKGLHLAEVLLERLCDLEISYDLVELNTFTEFPKLLLNVGIFSEIEEHRVMAVRVFLQYIKKCDWKSRYHLITQVISTVNHSQAEGAVITLYKQYLHSCLMGETSDTYFLGKNLRLFLSRVFLLAEGAETDIMENSDRIICALNFLIYLLKLKNHDRIQTDIQSIRGAIAGNFLNPLLTAINMSRAHYKQVAKDNEIECRNAKKRTNYNVRVGNEVLPSISPQIQREVFVKALLTFEMIESLYFRVQELF